MSEKRNICFLNTTKFWGGGEKWHFETAVALKEQGCNVSFVVRSGTSLRQKLVENNIACFCINIGTFSFLNPFKIHQLKSFFSRNTIHVVIMNGSADMKLGGIAAKFAGVEAIIYRRGLAAPVKPSAINRLLFKKVLTHFIVNSEATKKIMLSGFDQKVTSKPVKLLYNGLDLEAMDTHKATPIYNRHKGELVLGTAGRLVTQKGHSMLIKIAAKLKKHGVNFKLLIAGSGPLEKEIKQLATTLGVQKEIEFVGQLNGTIAFMRSIDVFLLTSKWEGFGFVLAEAMAAKKPCVGFNISSNPELIINEKTGYLIKPFDLDMFVEKVVSLGENETQRLTMGKTARAIVEKKFNKKTQVEKLRRFIFDEIPTK